MNTCNMLSTIFIGMAIAAPVGPISLLCIRTTLGSGFLSGLSAGLGAAAADGVISLAALTCLQALTGNTLFSLPLMNAAAAAFLIYIAIKMLLTARIHCSKNSAAADPHLGKSFISTFLYTALNPLTIISFAALFCGQNQGYRTIFEAILTSSCIFVGSAFWWLLLAAFLSIARRALNAAAMRVINFGSAFCILAYALKLIFS